jgi:hypothetical protein
MQREKEKWVVVRETTREGSHALSVCPSRRGKAIDWYYWSLMLWRWGGGYKLNLNGNRSLKLCIRAIFFLSYLWEGYMWSMQSNVEFGYQFRICSGTTENHEYKECLLLGYKNQVPTSQETHYISATEPNRLMLCGETIDTYCENRRQHTECTGSTYRTGKTSRLHYRDQPTNAVWGNSRCL